MKNRIIALLLSISAICLIFAGQAAGSSISFSEAIGGGFSITDADNDGWAETFSLGTAEITDWDGDGWFNGDETIVFSDMYLDQPSYDPDNPDEFYFSPNSYPNGFSLYDNGGTNLILTADLAASTLVTFGTIGILNPLLSTNLTNFTITSSYTGGSNYIDSLMTCDSAALNVALVTTSAITDSITTGSGAEGFLNGSSTPVPEPTTILLMGMGLLGFASFGRRRFMKYRSDKKS